MEGQAPKAVDSTRYPYVGCKDIVRVMNQNICLNNSLEKVLASRFFMFSP